MSDNTSYLGVIMGTYGTANTYTGGTALPYWNSNQDGPIGPDLAAGMDLAERSRQPRQRNCEYCGMPVKRCGCGRYR